MQLSTRHQGSRENNKWHLLRNHTERVCQWMGHCILHVMLGCYWKERKCWSYKEHWLDKSNRQDLKNIWEEMSFLLRCVWVKDLRISVTHRLSSRWKDSPRIFHLSKLMTVKDNAASMSYVNVGYQTEVIRLWIKACVQALTKPPYYEEDRIRLECRVSSIQQKKSGGFGEATRCHQRRKWSGFSGDFSDDSEELWCPEDDTTKGVWVTLEALFEEERRSRWLKVGCAKHVRGQVGKRVMSCSYLCPESLRNSKDNSLWYVARDARLWVPATQSKDMHLRRTFCGIRSGPNVTTGVVSMQRSHTSDLVRFSWQMLRRWLTKSSWNYDDVQNASTEDLESVTFGWDVRILDNIVQTWKVWVKEEKQLHLALEWSMIGERSGLERRWRYQGSRMITQNMTRTWRSIRIRRAFCAQCKTWSSLWRTIDWRWEFQWSRQVSIR